MTHSRALQPSLGRRAAALVALAGAAACATPTRLAYSGPDLQAEALRRAGTAWTEPFPVLFEVEPTQVEKAWRVVATHARREHKAGALIDALADPDHFGLAYLPRSTATAAETLQKGSGNCLSLASVLVGLARSVGLAAHYVDLSHRNEEVEDYGFMTVRSGHVTALVETENGYAGLSIDGRLSRFVSGRIMDDVEALAHYFNNRGVELLHEAHRTGSDAARAGAARHFVTAALLAPTLARAHNNLGVAKEQMGRIEEAAEAYREATRRDPDLISPHRNLGRLFLNRGDLDRAAAAFLRATELDPDNPDVLYQRAAVLFRLGQTDAARQALESVIERQRTHARARALMQRLDTAR